MVNELKRDIGMEIKRKSEFDIVKAIAIYLVVVGHVRNNVLYDVGGGGFRFSICRFFSCRFYTDPRPRDGRHARMPGCG